VEEECRSGPYRSDAFLPHVLHVLAIPQEDKKANGHARARRDCAQWWRHWADLIRWPKRDAGRAVCCYHYCACSSWALTSYGIFRALRAVSAATPFANWWEKSANSVHGGVCERICTASWRASLLLRFGTLVPLNMYNHTLQALPAATCLLALWLTRGPCFHYRTSSATSTLGSRRKAPCQRPRSDLPGSRWRSARRTWGTRTRSSAAVWDRRRGPWSPPCAPCILLAPVGPNVRSSGTWWRARRPSRSAPRRNRRVLCGLLDDGARNAGVVRRLPVIAKLADVDQPLLPPVFLRVQHVVAGPLARCRTRSARALPGRLAGRLARNARAPACRGAHQFEQNFIFFALRLHAASRGGSPRWPQSGSRSPPSSREWRQGPLRAGHASPRADKKKSPYVVLRAFFSLRPGWRRPLSSAV